MKKIYIKKSFAFIIACCFVVMSFAGVVFADENNPYHQEYNIESVTDSELDYSETDGSEPENREEILPDSSTEEDVINEDDAITSEDSLTSDEGISPADEDASETPDVTAEEAEEVLELDLEIDPEPGYFIADDLTVCERTNAVSEAGSGVYTYNFTGVDLATYNKLKSQIQDVSYGRRSSTVFYIPVSELGLKSYAFRAEELGVDWIYDRANNKLNQEAANAIFSKLTGNWDLVIDALLADCPFDLYWYNKTAYTRYNCDSSLGLGYDSEHQEYTMTVSPNANIIYYLPVVSRYAADTYEVSAAGVAIAQSANTTAKSIVSKYASYPDLVKLNKYKEEICDLASYNSDAAGGGVAYGDPWNPVYVFDGDPDTNVVCEGYSKAFQYLCNLTDFESDEISCISVTGVMVSSSGYGPHMWNIISFGNGTNFLVDVTNCDTGTIGAPTLLFIRNYDIKESETQYKFTCNGRQIAFLYDDDTMSMYKDEALVISPDALVSAPAVTCSVKHSATGCGVNLSWSSMSGASKYRVYRRTADSDWAAITDTTSLTYTDTTVTEGTKYYYSVRGIRSSGYYMNALTDDYSITFTVTHTSVTDPAVAADCENSGLTAGSHCSVCGNVLVAQTEVPAKGHKIVVDPYVAPTYTEPGLTEGSHCSECGKVIVAQQEIEALGLPLSIVTQPSDFSGSVGKKAIFTVVAEGEGLTYQWQYFNGTSWSKSTSTGSDTATLSIKITEGRDGQKYRCVVKDKNNERVISNTVSIKVLVLPIVSQPSDCIDKIGKKAVFNVEASGTGLTYQWQFNNGTGWHDSTASGSNTSSLSVKITQARDGQKYRCIISDDRGATATSEPACIHVGTPLKITTQPANIQAPAGKYAKFTVEAEGDELKYQWQYNNGTGWHKSSTAGYDTATLKIKITEARNGQQYRCIITDRFGVSVTSEAATMLVGPAITLQPSDFVGVIGTKAVFTVKAEGEGLTYKWQYNNGTGWHNSTSAGYNTPSLSIKATEARNGQMYRCVVTDMYGCVTSNEVSIIVVD
ncbi:MAG: hypothetical protein IKM72_12050 [Oscillospiraceae bacterium]|nr:hypothetical protein [Oscillospiraceae bacterium]